MGRRSSRELVGDIAETLTTDPQSIQEISDKVGADRQSVTKYLEELEDAGIVKEEKSGRTRKFYVSEYENNESYFKLPLNEEQREKFKFLFSRILGEYRDQFGRMPSKLMYQKIAVKVIKDLDLRLPYGRYKYGSLTAMNYTPGDGQNQGPVEFGPGFDETKFEEEVKNVVSDYGELGFHETRKKQYEEENMELYQKKEEIMKKLAGQINDISEFERDLHLFLAKTPPLEEDVEEALVDFIAVSSDLVDDAYNRSKVMETFKEFWELIAFYCFREDMSKFYDEDVLESRMASDRNEKWEEVKQALTELISLYEDETDHEVSEELEELKGSAEELPDEEKQARAEELKEMDSEDLSREFDL